MCRRIYEILPSQIQRWQSSPCVGEENNKKTLEKLRKEQMDARITIGELDKKHQELDALLERCKKVTIDQDLDVSRVLLDFRNKMESMKQN